MKVLILTRKRLIVFGVLVLLCGFGVGLTLWSYGSQKQAVQTAAAATERRVPIYAVETEEKKIAISFDAAWGNEQTQELLDILDAYQVKTTFFLVGDWVDRYPESVAAIVSAGHEIGNHSNTHPQMSQLSQEDQIAELQRCNEKIKAITGSSPTVFRAPYGDYNNALLDAADRLGMDSIQWDVDSLDWKELSAQEITQRVLSQVKNGSIVLFHNGGLHTPEALPILLETLQKEGYTIVPVSELIYPDPYQINPNTGLQQKLSTVSA